MYHYRINEIKTRIDESPAVLVAKVAKAVGVKPSDIAELEIRRRAIDSRRKPDIRFVYTVDFKCLKYLGKKAQLIDDSKVVEEEPTPGDKELKGRPVVVGMGPCGIFAALELAKRGWKPLVLERGPAMDGRVRAVEEFRTTHVLNPEANMLFGEGGAGTFSDGKLGTGIKDGNIRNVLRTFADAGAGEDITYLAKPHIGTDVLRTTITNLRNKIIECGGEVRFNTRVDSFKIVDGELESIEVTNGSATETIHTNALVLAIGHSARDTFAVLNDAGFNIEQKAFSIGVRMEHPQSMIDEAQYGKEALAKYGELLPPADYKISTRVAVPAGTATRSATTADVTDARGALDTRGVYSFCMCPGGEVVVCSTKEGELCVNGMSNRKRDSGTANSGILCEVRISDYNNGDESDVLAGVRFQEKYEKLAYENGGGTFNPPKSTMADFLANHSPQIDNSLPDYAANSIRAAVPEFARKISGYDNPAAIVTAVETRSSSPVRIIRDENGESNIHGIFPAGEGAGYAGGITSAACDGIRAAHNLIRKYEKYAR